MNTDTDKAGAYFDSLFAIGYGLGIPPLAVAEWTHGFTDALLAATLNPEAFGVVARAYLAAQDADTNIGPPPEQLKTYLRDQFSALARSLTAPSPTKQA